VQILPRLGLFGGAFPRNFVGARLPLHARFYPRKVLYSTQGSLLGPFRANPPPAFQQRWRLWRGRLIRNQSGTHPIKFSHSTLNATLSPEGDLRVLRMGSFGGFVWEGLLGRDVERVLLLLDCLRLLIRDGALASRRFRAKRKNRERFYGLLPESPGHNMALTVCLICAIFAWMRKSCSEPKWSAPYKNSRPQP